MRILLVCLLTAAACGSDSTPAKMDAAKMDGTGSGALDCGTYCSKITAACTTTNAQYGAMDTCMASCSHFPVGTAADQSGDTLGCRIYHTMLAMTDPTTHCVHAGPSGGGACGMPCEGFCSL